VVGDADTLDQKCKFLSDKHVEKMKKDLNQDYTLIRTDSFYSKKLDSCIHTEVAEVGVKVVIRDLSYSLFDKFDGRGFRNVLLYCDRHGADSVIVEKVRKYRGRVFRVPYREYLDDGFGGPPSALKTPDKPYTKEDCGKVFDKWMQELK